MFDTKRDTYASAVLGTVAAVIVALVLRPEPGLDPLYTTMVYFGAVLAALLFGLLVFLVSNAAMTNGRR